MSRFQSSIATLRALEAAARFNAKQHTELMAGVTVGSASWTACATTAGLSAALTDIFHLAAADLEQQQAAENGRIA